MFNPQLAYFSISKLKDICLPAARPGSPPFEAGGGKQGHHLLS
jgi:hypothetical protein